MRQSYFIYKYVKDNKIIYIGKTKRPLNERINEHKADLPTDADIYYLECKSESDMNITELFLIDKYRPEFNRDCVTESEPTSIPFEEPEWKPISVYFTPVKVFLGYEEHNGIKAVYYNSKTGKRECEKVNYCECDVDFPQEILLDNYSYNFCTECGKMIRNSFKEVLNADYQLEYKNYKADIKKSVKDNLYYGNVTGIKDSLYFHGRNQKELETAFKNCIEDYIKMLPVIHT